MAADEMERVREALRRLMDRKGIKAKPLSKSAGLGDTAVRDILEGRSEDIRVGTLRKLATELGCDVEDLMGVAMIPLVGRVGAGGEVIFEDLGVDENVPRPPVIGGRLDALEVAGNSMLPRYSSGDIVYVARERTGVNEAFFGEYCAVRLTSGETYVKLLARGSRPGYVTLRSLNAPDIEDVEIDWATPIVFVMPRLARTMLIAR